MTLPYQSSSQWNRWSLVCWVLLLWFFLCVCVWICACSLHPSSLPHAQLLHAFVCGKYKISDRFCSVRRLWSLFFHCSGLRAGRVVPRCPWVLRHWNAGHHLSFSLLFCLLFCHHWLFSSLLSGVSSSALSIGFCSWVSPLTCLFCHCG